MKISSEDFLEKYKQLFLTLTTGIGIFAFWKMKYLIENGESFFLSDYGCYYTIYNNHLVIYHSPDNKMHLSLDALNKLDCISIPANIFDIVKEHLTGFNPSYDWGLKYNFAYNPPDHTSLLYDVVDFDFTNSEHFEIAAKIIDIKGDWINERNIRKMMTYSAFDPSLWFFIKDATSQELAAISISAYDAEVKQTDLDWIYVAPEYQGKGCGRYLIEETIRRCKDRSKSICVGGQVGFYRKCGFVNDTLWVWAPKQDYQFKAYGITPEVI